MLSFGYEDEPFSSNTVSQDNPLFWKNPNCGDIMLVKPLLKSLPIHPCSFLTVIINRNAVFHQARV
jgi:hypothetical protein